MALTLPSINTAADSFQNFIDKTNAIINAVSNSVLTANGAANGSLVSGNVAGNGIFSYTTVAVGTALRGGNVQATTNLALTSNLIVTGAVIMLNANITLTNNSLTIGANTVIADTGARYGNSTVNSTINSTALVLPTITVTGTTITSGNSTVNAVVNTSGVYISGAALPLANNKTVVAVNGTLIGNATRINLVGSGSSIITGSVDVGNSQVNVVINSTVSLGNTGGSNTNVLFNQNGLVGGSNGLNFDTTANNLSIGNNVTVGANVTLGHDQLFVGNSTVNAILLSTSLALGNSVHNTSGFYIGALIANGSTLYVGNSTVFSSINSTAIGTASFAPTLITVGNSVINTTSYVIGNTTINTTAFALGATIINTSTIAIGANVVFSAAQLLYGNSTVSYTANSTQWQLANSTIAVVANTTGITIGANSSVTYQAVTVGSSVVNAAGVSAVLYAGNGVMATANQYWANAAGIVVTTDKLNAAGAYSTITDGASPTWDMSKGINFTWTIAGNRTVPNPSNVVVGRSGVLQVIEDATGSRTLSFANAFIFDSDTAPVISTVANKQNFLFYHCVNTSQILITLAAKGV